MNPCGTKTAYNKHLKLGEIPCGPCKEASRVSARESYARNPESRRAYYLANRARISARMKAHRDRSWMADRVCPACASVFTPAVGNQKFCSGLCRQRVRYPNSQREWPASPQPERTRGRPWARLRRQVLDEESTCYLCGDMIDQSVKWPDSRSPTADHVVPIRRGGASMDRDNLRAAHLGCNQRKGSRSIAA